MCLNFSKWSPLQASHRDVFSGVLKDLNNLSFLASSLVIPMKRWERVTGHRSPSPVPLTLYTSLTESGRNSGAHMSQYCKAPFSCLTTYCSHIILCNTQNRSSFFNTIYGHVFHTTLCLLVLEREDLSNGFKGIKWGNSFSFLSHQTISLIGRLISLYVCRLKMWRYNIHSFYISRWDHTSQSCSLKKAKPNLDPGVKWNKLAKLELTHIGFAKLLVVIVTYIKNPEVDIF